MKVTDFVLKFDGQGRRYFQNVAEYETKKRESKTNDKDVQSARVYEISGK